MKLIRMKDLPPDFPVKKSTLYAWHHFNKYPGFLVKVGGSLCVDMDRINETIKTKEVHDV